MLNLDEAFPQSFDFYGLGEVRTLESDNFPSKELFDELSSFHAAISYRVSGDLNFWILLLLDFNLKNESSLFSEMGNIIASRIVSQLNEKRELDLVLFPPQTINLNNLNRLNSFENVILSKTYGYYFKGAMTPTPITLVILENSLEEKGYA